MNYIKDIQEIAKTRLQLEDQLLESLNFNIISAASQCRKSMIYVEDFPIILIIPRIKEQIAQWEYEELLENNPIIISQT